MLQLVAAGRNFKYTTLQLVAAGRCWSQHLYTRMQLVAANNYVI